MNSKDRYRQASFETANNLKNLIASGEVSGSNQLSAPEVDAVVDRLSKVIPAGNVPGMILSGLSRLQGRKLQQENVQRDINLLFTGVEQAIERVAYFGFFAGPAAVIWAYQNLLKLAGIEPADAFPEGTWQFYVAYALREDTARHAHETHGFDTVLRQHDIYLDKVERMTAWVMAAVNILQQYDSILANEWRERAYTAALKEVTRQLPEASYYAGLYRQWSAQRPFGRGPDAQDSENFADYRLNRFMHFLQNAAGQLPETLYHEWLQRIRMAEQDQLPLFQRQMSIQAYLEPGRHSEIRRPIPLEAARVGLIYQGQYFLLPVVKPGTQRLVPVEDYLNAIAGIVSQEPDPGAISLIGMADIRRSALASLRNRLSPDLVRTAEQLRQAPILLNFDPRPADLPLAEIRRAERGLGDHALTVFDTGQSMVFDQSHIFFDGAWGAALAEIMTNEALSWGVYLHQFPPETYAPTYPRPLRSSYRRDDLALIERAPRSVPEATAETGLVNAKAIYLLRKLFKRRSDLIRLTVNDLLILYRAIHAATYRPSPALIEKLKSLAQKQDTQPVAQAAYKVIQEGARINPSILIPVDVTPVAPGERIYPMSFEVPLDKLKLLELHRKTIACLDGYERGERKGMYQRFDQLQRTYLATLAAFGEVLSRTKEIAMSGESASVSSLKLLAHLPPPLQRMLDSVSGRFEWMNDIIKGREVFSNIGKIAHTSTLTRFLTAKDDNDHKDLVWGVMTDREDRMRITLRDFRAHVSALHLIGKQELANDIAQDYLDAYAEGLNAYIADMHRITIASRETKLSIRYPSRQKAKAMLLEKRRPEQETPAAEIEQPEMDEHMQT